MPVVSVHILYVGDSAYDLRKVSSAVPTETAGILAVRFIDDPRTTVLFDSVTFLPAWEASLNSTGGGGGPPSGPAGGDLGGTYPNPDVVGLQGVPVSNAAPAGGQQLVYNALTNTWEPALVFQYFADSTAAVAAAPFINGTYVVLYPGSPESEAGTYQVTANGGAAFPADYTKVSDHTDTASEVGIVDAGDFYVGTDVEAALQEVGNGTIKPLTGAVPLVAGAIDSVLAASFGGGTWEVEVVNGNLRYRTTLSVAHDGSTASLTESGAVAGPGVGVLPITFNADISGANLRITAVSSAPGWTYYIRRMALLPA